MSERVSVHARLKGIALAACLFFAFTRCAEPKELTWYRGNTHAHTVDTRASPDEAAAYYMSLGYNFLCITDHNRLTSPISVTFPIGGRTDFILIPSEEITENVHATAMNIKTLVSPSAGGSQSNKLKKYLKDANRTGGILIANHPNYEWALTAVDMKRVPALRLFELYNCYPGANNEGDVSQPSTESLWDSLLTGGMEVYGIASDDTTFYPTNPSRYISCPGRGWVMVHATDLSAAAICDALLHGRFYAHE